MTSMHGKTASVFFSLSLRMKNYSGILVHYRDWQDFVQMLEKEVGKSQHTNYCLDMPAVVHFKTTFSHIYLSEEHT